MWWAENKRGNDILHFAPERAVTHFLKPHARRYVTADLYFRCDLRLDIESIDLPDSSFDVVCCLHVLEHVDDRKALPELYRIVRPGGFCLLMVPIIEGWDTTYENPAATSEKCQSLFFGQAGHLRLYGADFAERVERAGFSVSVFVSGEPFVSRHGLMRGEKLFIARK